MIRNLCSIRHSTSGGVVTFKTFRDLPRLNQLNLKTFITVVLRNTGLKLY